MAVNIPTKKIGSMTISEQEKRNALQGMAEGTKYSGAGDLMIEFGKATSFLNEATAGRVITMKVANASASNVKVALYPGQIGSLLTAAGYQLMTDGQITASVTGSARPSSVACIKAYADANPTRINKIQFQVDDVAQYSEPLLYRTYDPFTNTYKEEERIPENYQSAQDFNTKCVTIDDIDGWQFEPMSALLLEVQAGRTVTIAFACGASIDLAKALNKKKVEAAQNVVRVIAKEV